MMTILATERIKINGKADSKESAIRQAGELLVDTGCVSPEYVEGMLARENTMSTYLGNGVAIPHGQFENRAHVLKTGISVLQLPDGVVWEDDEKAFLVIGIASDSDEHINILSALAEVIEEEEDVQALVNSNDPMEILKKLSETASE